MKITAYDWCMCCISLSLSFSILNKTSKQRAKEEIPKIPDLLDFYSPNRFITGWKTPSWLCTPASESDSIRAHSLSADALLLSEKPCICKFMSRSLTQLPAVLLDRNIHKRTPSKKSKCSLSVKMPCKTTTRHGITIRECNFPTRNNKILATSIPTKTTNLHTATLCYVPIGAKTTRCVTVTLWKQMVQSVSSSLWTHMI